ncbi:Myb-related transcription factor, partner of profilin-like [Oopsacas minuta]|uniref:Myb-related transcription factor, partner of profilin-like n=1 Tax=Oopsacas minuta TaxID=111878 RepID=A0AAV7JR24_9METZ|nr:Myb-related transcription factor, partner of profilin-like [Oopsacas minuta]
MLTNYDNILPIALIMTIEKSKTRSKNVIQEEVMSLVDLIHDQKSKLFGALTSTLTFDDKNKIWEEISGRLFELDGNVRTRDDVTKKWKKTEGDPADADLNEIEAKNSSIKGKEAFEGFEPGIDLSLESQCANDETERMLISPVPSEDIEQIKFFQQAPRKRHRLENDELESTKRAILEKEDKKLEI